MMIGMSLGAGQNNLLKFVFTVKGENHLPFAIWCNSDGIFRLNNIKYITVVLTCVSAMQPNNNAHIIIVSIDMARALCTPRLITP